uniref:Uncharacterized protein n=1 Tax=Rhizophora mucronata TaxID=61149 RepID=A0A2P2P089_RHIMU
MLYIGLGGLLRNWEIIFKKIPIHHFFFICGFKRALPTGKNSSYLLRVLLSLFPSLV